MAKVYRVTCRGETWEQVANNAAEVKSAVASKYGMKKMPKGTTVAKIGLAKGKVTPSRRKSGTGTVSVVSKQERYLRKQAAKAMKGTVLHGPDGATYTVGQRGRKPSWVSEQLGEATSPVVPAKILSGAADRDGLPSEKKKKEGMEYAWQVAAKAMTLSNVSYVIDNDGVISHGFVSDEASISIPKGTVYAITFQH